MMTIPDYSLIAPVCEAGDLLLYRATRKQDGVPVLLKIPATDHLVPLLLNWLEREFELARNLDASRISRPLALECHDGHVALVLESGPDRTLASMLGLPMDTLTFLRLAIGITDALAELHRHELVHKNLKPEHVLLDASGHVWLTGLGIASRLPRERQSPQSPELIVGTLAYMAPEQTGRMNRSIDSRSDLYALGVVFYQMLTGALPFTANDPMEWVHCHIARQPVPPQQRVPNLPEPISAMVMKLLAKAAEDRYQSVTGLAADLRRCLALWESKGRIDSFSLGAQDVSGRLLIPEKLYGRQAEIDTLLAAFDQVVTSGKLEFVLVSGYSGIGKTAVVNELHKALVPPRGLFAAGKFDQYKRDIPYATLIQALQALVRYILGKSEAEVAAWRETIQQAVSPNGQLIVGLIPEIELIIGQQPPVPELAPQEAQNRFQRVLRCFLGALADAEHPLALFLDDLQWLDAATLALIEQLVIGQEVHHLLLIGAYRDNEVGPTHPLMRVLNAIRKAEIKVHEIVLAPLALEDVNRLVADTLHCEVAHAQPLAELVYQKSGGNPFYVIQFFTALVDEHLLAFDSGNGGWVWDLPRIAAKGYTDNIVELMARKLVRLPAATQEALKHFACLGNTATIATLCRVRNVTEDELHRSLWEAVQPGLIIRGEDDYTFLHDRVQEAAYSLIPEDERPAMHLHIGRLLASRQADELQETIFEVVNQFNRATALIDSAEERERVAALNLQAGKRAKSATAYQSALTFLCVGESLLPEDPWQPECYALSFALSLNRAECEYLTNQYAIAEQRLLMLTKSARDLVDLAAVTFFCIDLYMRRDWPDRAIEMCLDYLRRLGIDWPVHPSWEDVLPEYERMWQLIGDRPVESLVDLPLMTDPEWRGAIDVLTSAIPPSQVIDGNLLCLIVARAVNISLEHGNSDGSCQPYVYMGMLLGQRFDNYSAAFQFGKLALDLVNNRGLERFKGRVYISVGAFLNPWGRHISSGRPQILSAFDILTQSGDFTWAGYCGINFITSFLVSGEPLDEVQLEAEPRLQAAQKASFGLVIDVLTGQLGLIHALRGLTVAPSSFSTSDFDENLFRDHLESDPRLSFSNCSYWIRKLQACFYAGEYESAIEAAIKAERYLFTFPSFFETAEYYFYRGLAHAAYCVSKESEAQKWHFETLTIHHKKIAAWSENCPENFANRAALLAAEIARIEGRELDAQNYYEAAIRAARENGFVQNEGLGYELASGFYRARGFIKFADTYIGEARACYARWGAAGKVKQLERAHPWLAESRTPDSLAVASFTEQLDVMAVAKAQRAISGEIVRERLTETLLRIVLESAGAQRGYLFVEPDTELLAELGADGKVEASRIAAGASSTASAAILNYVRRTRETVILADAASDAGDFATDAYLLQAKPRSVLCMPILRQATLIGVLYLENNLAAGAFTPDRHAVLEILASQAAISLENALVYEALQESEAKYRRIIDTANEGIWLLGPDTTILSVNARMSEMLGYAQEEMVGRKGLDFMFDEDMPDHLKHMERRRQGKSESYELRFRHRNGEALWTLVSATPIIDEGNHFTGMFGMFTDITERKQSEEELRKHREHLEELVSERTAQLEVANKELEAFSYSVSHDLRTPLRAIDGFSRLLETKYDMQLDGEARRLIQVVRDSAARMGQLIDDILAFSRSGRMELHMVHVDMRALIDAAWLDLEAIRTGRIIELSICELPAVMGDPIMLRQVWLNLLANAIKFTNQCSVAHIEIGCTENAEVYTYYIKDDGVGFDQNYAHKLFGVFQRLHAVDEFEGTGIGLAIVKRIISRHGGTVSAEGKVGEGAIIRITLPKREDENVVHG